MTHIIRNDRVDHYLEGLNTKASLYIDTQICSEIEIKKIKVSWYVIKLKIVISTNLY